jgi:hypothetical protein
MAKRTRGSTRPGQRHSHTPAKPQTRPIARPGQGLSAAEEAHAAELEGQILEQEGAAKAAVARSRDRRDAEPLGGVRPRGQSPLAIRAAEEYSYVTRDVRRILTVGGTMVGILAVLVVLIDVLHVFSV